MLRWAKTNAAGVVQAGASNGYATNSVIQVGVSIELEAGADLTQKNGCGAICQAIRTPDKIKRVNLSLTLCQLDAELIQLMAGGTVVTDPVAGDAIGYFLPKAAGTTNYGVLEVFSTAWDGESQAVLGADLQYFDFVFPLSTFLPGDWTIEEGILAFPLEGFSSENQNITNKGPFNDWPLGVSTLGGADSAANFFLMETLPTSACDYLTVPAQTS